MAKKKKSNAKKQSNRAAFQYMQTKQAEGKPMSKFGKQKKVTIQGTEYTLQHPGTRRSIEFNDEAININTGMFSSAKLYELYMKEVVVEPKVSYDYFDKKPGFLELMKEVQTFLSAETEAETVLQKEGE
ncbi:hypothetical protein B4143_4353 [Bacillus subtilis]|uniref:Uncharacterized protein n=2 Tax=Bacillaceae TaxID=186817 RepID=A0A8I2B805_BACIU|nr:hypothetical protein [Bacillus licheniformis]KIO58726.1 hypothetical protein B4143_4353 [Bacillus subtilis]MBO3793230.1 hypothetical protein [Bacillus subtilis]MED4302234.1 hypothetical protein [Bacillus licheniformis]MED4382798.1 hypothetical protein [Bacillus licheniformis]